MPDRDKLRRPRTGKRRSRPGTTLAANRVDVWDAIAARARVRLLRQDHLPARVAYQACPFRDLKLHGESSGRQFERSSADLSLSLMSMHAPALLDKKP